MALIIFKSSIYKNDVSCIRLGNTKHEMLCCLVLIIVHGLFGCSSKFIAGDTLSILAEIRDIQGQQLNNCTIQVQNQNGEILDGPDSIPGKFHKVFIVASRKANYLISISCPGFKTYQTSAIYGVNITSIRPLRLGVIIMKALQE